MASKKKAPKRTRSKRSVAEPPGDNPLLRYEQLRRDRLSGTERRQRPTGKRGAVFSLTAGIGTKSAEPIEPQSTLRAAAFRISRQMPVTRPGIFTMAPAPGASNWVQMGPACIPKGQALNGSRIAVTGRITSIAIDPTDPNRIYLGAAQGGVWKTVDGGATWTAKSDNEVSLSIGALAIDPTNPLVIYAATGEGNFSLDSYYGNGVLKSVDGGNSWTVQGATTFAGARFTRIVVNPTTPGILFASTNAGLFRTMDGGMNWTPMTNGLPPAGSSPGATDVAIDPTNPSTVYVAFWAGGVFKTTNANAANPTFTRLAGGFPSTGITRIALGMSPSSPQTIYALISNVSTTLATTSFRIDKFFVTTNGGANWSAIPLPGGNIGQQGFYNLNVVVDPTTPDIVYLSATSLYKAVRNPATNAFTITDIGRSIHADNHAFAVHPTSHLTVYACNDGGIYKSTDGGATWTDTINKGLCITQIEFIDQHPSLDAVVFAGTQDNGTVQFRNSVVFDHADDGDGGFVAVDPNTPANIIHTYFGPSPSRSTQAGKFGSFIDVSDGLGGNSLFYPPFTLDATNPNNVAFGTDQIFLDTAQGTGSWPTSVALPGTGGNVSAVSYVNSNLIYAATELGQVYRLDRSAGAWTARAIHAAPLPGRYVWDVQSLPTDPNTVVLVMSGFGTPHVWRGAVPAGGGAAAWTDISGTGPGRLPDIPVNALVIEPGSATNMYIATDVAVFRTSNGGTTWVPFSQGLPNCAVFDLQLHAPTRLLRAGTHGRGLWERQLDATGMPDVNIYVRDNLVDTGRQRPSPSNIAAPFEDPLQQVALGDSMWWFQCADIKIDALEGVPLSYQMAISSVDYVAFESKLEHRNPQRGRVNRVYVQVHNRGIIAAPNVTVRALFADASAGLPPLPADFWTTFPGDSADTSVWTPVGPAQIIPQVLPTQPAIVEWNWTTPATAARHTCMLVVIDCPSDPIPAGSKVFDIATLVTNEKRVGLKNLHVIDVAPGAMHWTGFQFAGSADIAHTIQISPITAKGWKLALLFPKNTKFGMTGLKTSKPTASMLKALNAEAGDNVKQFDTATLYSLQDTTTGASLSNVKFPKGILRAMLLVTPPAQAGRSATFSIVQMNKDTVEGGSTFVLRSRK